MGGSGKGNAVADEGLAAPERAVVPQPGAVEDEADGRLKITVLLRQDGSQVGVVMLDTDQLVRIPVFLCEAGGQIVRVLIRRQQRRLCIEHLREIADLPPEAVQGGQIVQIADMLAEEGFAAPGQTEGVLLLSPAGQDGAAAIQDGPGLRRVTTAAAGQAQAAGGIHGHGIVAAAEDGPIVSEEEIGQA